MNPDTLSNLLALLRRLFLAVLALGIGGFILLRAWHIGQMLLGLAFFLLAAVIVAPGLARVVVEPLGGLFWPRYYNKSPQPIYSIPRAKRLKGLLEEAMAGYEQIAADHPDEVQPYIEMVDIALRELNDPERANRIFERGVNALKRADDRDVLARAYAAAREPATPKPTRIVSLPGRPPDGAESPTASV